MPDLVQTSLALPPFELAPAENVALSLEPIRAAFAEPVLDFSGQPRAPPAPSAA